MIINFHFLITRFAVQIILVVVLNALFTDVVIGGVVLCQSFFIQCFQIAIVDFDT